MSKIAIDIVLLPPEEIINLSIAINKASYESKKGRFPLSKTDFVPHISLAMGCIYQKDLQEIISPVEQTSKTLSPLDLKVEGISHYVRYDGNRSYLKVNLSEELRNLHKTVLDSVSKYFCECDSKDVLIEGEKTGISDSSKKILNNFKESYSNENYSPHITLCCYDANEFCSEKFPIEFKTSKLAIFQVGDGCTCRKLLYSIDLE